MKEFLSALIIVILFIYCLLYIGYVVSGTAHCYVKGVELTGKPWKWEGNSRCTITHDNS